MASPRDFGVDAAEFDIIRLAPGKRGVTLGQWGLEMAAR